MCSFVVFWETSEPCILFSSEGLIIEGSLIAELVSVFIETSCIGFVQADKHKLKNKKVLFNKYKQIDELNIEIIDDFIDKIEIGEYNENQNNRNIHIIWNFEE